MGLTVDHQRAGAADTFTAITLEGDWLLVLVHEPLVHVVEHLQEARVGADLAGIVRLEATFVAGAVLAPDFEGDVD